MGQTWTYKYGDNTIVIKNHSNTLELIVNGEVQDKKTGIVVDGTFKGTLPGGEIIKASLDGVFTTKCNLYVDNQLLVPEEL